MENSGEQDHLDKRSLEKRLFIKHELKRLTRRTHSELRGERGYIFSSKFRRCPLEFSIHCSLEEFSKLCEHINSKHASGVRYRPSLNHITSYQQPLSEKHVIFDNYNTLLEWIGVSTAEEQRFYLQQSIKRKGNHVVQVMGGANWDVTSNLRPLNIFVGKSCSRSIDGTKSELLLDANATDEPPHGFSQDSLAIESPNLTSCITLPTTQWDDDNGTFIHNFKLGTGVTNCELLTHSDVLDFDAFTITWRPLPGLRSQDISNITSERIVIGSMVVFIPAVVIAGESECRDLSSLLNNFIAQ